MTAPISCPVGEFTSTNDYFEKIQAPIFNWYATNPTKHPQYIIFFKDIPTRFNNIADPDELSSYGSVDFNLNRAVAGIQPFITHINMGDVDACKAYIDKLAYFAAHYSPGKLLISASSGGYGNSNYYIEGNLQFIAKALITNGVPTNNVFSSTNYQHACLGTNVAGYTSWGWNGGLGGNYITNGLASFSGASGWWLIKTIESFNGQQNGGGFQGNFIKWFSRPAFGGTNYENTPVGAITHTEEPGGGPACAYGDVYFCLWAAGKNFAMCAWDSRGTPYFQAVGDPLVTK